MEEKKVVYNGGVESYSGCTNPSILEIGKVYVVREVNEGKWQTNYKLKGVNGEFNSVWFCDPIKPSYIAIGRKKPVQGGRTSIYRLCDSWNKITTSIILSVESISANIYKVETKNSIYIIQVR